MSAAGVDVSDAVKGTSDYYKAVFDKNKTTKDQIIKIFENIEKVDRRYSVKIDGQCTELSHCRDYILKLASIMGRSTNVDSANFNIDIQNTMAPALVAIYTDRLCSATTDEDGNRIYEYDFEKIRDIMQKDSKKVPVEMYTAMINMFTDMPEKDKGQFILNSYFQNMDDSGDSHYSYWDISPVFITMAGLYELEVQNMDLSYENLSNTESDIHKYIANCAILNQVAMQASSLYINDNVLFQHPSKFFSIQVDNISGSFTKWDYKVSFLSEGLGDVTQPISVYQFRNDMSAIFEETTVPLLESFRRDVGSELLKKSLGVVQGYAEGFLQLAGSMSFIKKATKFGVETLTLFSDVDENNKKVDNLISMIKDEHIYRALQLGASVSVTPDGKVALNQWSIDPTQLDMALRAYETKTGCKLNLNAQIIEQSFKDDSLEKLDMKVYRDWYLSYGDYEKDKYKEDIEHALNSCKDKLKNIEAAINYGTISLSSLSDDEKKILDIKEILQQDENHLNYEQIKQLEQFFQ